MSPTETALATPSATGVTDPSRERSIRLVLVGLVILIAGFTAMLLANGLYPCVPASVSGAEPPLTDCAVALSPWAGLAVIGLALALVGYRRSG